MNKIVLLFILITTLFLGGCATPPPPASCEDNGLGMHQINPEMSYLEEADYVYK